MYTKLKDSVFLSPRSDTAYANSAHLLLVVPWCEADEEKTYGISNYMEI